MGIFFDIQDTFEEYLTENHRAFLAKSFFKIETVSSLLERLKSDSSLRRICGFIKVPSAPTFSRRMNDFSKKNVMEKIFYPMVRSYHSDRITGHISRDSTAITAREKPGNKKKDASIIKPKQKKEGVSEKGSMYKTG